MSNIIPFDSTGAAGAAQLPAHLASVFGEDGNIAPRTSINQLSYRGKTWRRVIKGEEIVLTRTSQDTGEQEPVPVVSVVILDHNKNRSRSFFEGNYEEGKNTAPRCYSTDGVTPDASVHEPICGTCAQCPNAVKGSKITESGKATTACSPFKRVAVIPSAQIGQHPAMLLKLAQTSIWDKDNPEEAKGWYAWDNYLDMLRARGAKHTAMVETRIKFDLTAYPKLLFSASRWLSPEEALSVKAEMDKQADDMKTIIEGAGNTDGVMGHPQTAAEPAASAPAQATTASPAPAPAPAAAAPVTPKPKPKPPAPAPAAAPAEPPKLIKTMTEKADGFSLADMLAEGWTEDQLVAEGMLVITEEAAAKPKAPPKPKGPAKPPAAAPAASSDADDSGGFGAAPAPAPAAAKPPAAAAAAVETGTPAGLASLLDGWDDSEG